MMYRKLGASAIKILTPIGVPHKAQMDVKLSYHPTTTDRQASERLDSWSALMGSFVLTAASS